MTRRLLSPQGREKTRHLVRYYSVAPRALLTQIKNAKEGVEPVGLAACFSRMMTRALQTGLGGKFFCSTCYEELKRDDQLVGLVSGTVYDIRRCPRCATIHWTARPPGPNRMAS